MNAKEFLHVALGGNMNFGTLKPLAIEEIMEQYHIQACRNKQDPKEIIEALEEDLSHAERQAKDAQPDYPWEDRKTSRASQIAYALCTAIQGIEAANSDCHKKIGELQKQKDELLEASVMVVENLVLDWGDSLKGLGQLRVAIDNAKENECTNIK